MAEYKEFDDGDINDGFPLDFDAKKHKLRGNNGSTKQEGVMDEYDIKGLRTIDRKTKPIFECIGQILMDYGEGIENMRSGTGTVFGKLPNQHYVVLTCGHNLVKYDKITKKEEAPKKVWFLPKGCAEFKCRLQFVAKAIYNEYKPENDLCPHDLAVILFRDKKGNKGHGSQHYDGIDVDKVVQVIEWNNEEDPELNLYGYPSKSQGLLQGTAGEVELKRDRGIWTYEDIYTYPGQSGSAIFKRLRKKEYAVHGIHTFGDIVKQQNCGIFLDAKKREWIKNEAVKFQEIAKENAPKHMMVKTASKDAVSVETEEWMKNTVGLSVSDIKILFDNGYNNMKAMVYIEEQDLKEMGIKRAQMKQIMHFVKTLPQLQPLKVHKRPKDDDSDEDKKKKKEMPPNPPIIAITETKPTSAVISIQSNKETVLEYKLEYREKEEDGDDEKLEWSSIIVENGRKQYEIGKLKADTEYFLRCAAKNSVEWCEFTKTVVFKTKMDKTILFTFKERGGVNVITNNGLTMKNIDARLWWTTLFGDFLSIKTGSKYSFKFRLDEDIGNKYIAIGFVTPAFNAFNEWKTPKSCKYKGCGYIYYDKRRFKCKQKDGTYTKRAFFGKIGDTISVEVDLVAKKATLNGLKIHLPESVCMAIFSTGHHKITVVKQTVN